MIANRKDVSLDWITINKEQPIIPSNILNRLLTNQLGGVHIKNFISNEQLKEIQNKLTNPFLKRHFVNSALQIQTLEGFNLAEGQDSYFDEVEQNKVLIQLLFGVDFEQSMVTFFKRLTKEKKIKRLKLNGCPCKTLIVRLNEKHIPLHNEIWFYENNTQQQSGKHQAFFNRIDFQHHLSAFMVLKKPDKGGLLKIYTPNHFNLPPALRQKSIEELAFILPRFYPSKVFNDLEEGDMVIFAASNIWHEITPMEGKRWSAGCFIGQSSTESDTLYYWI